MIKTPGFKKPIPKTKIQAIGILTSGGDAPGMNAAIRAAVRYAKFRKIKIYAVKRGYSGLMDSSFSELSLSSVANVLQRGGTILKTDRCEDFFKKSFRKKAVKNLRDNGIDGLVVIGGDGSFRGAHAMGRETGFPVIGIPGTIDNDIPQTDLTIGFDTAVNTALEAIDRIRDTASSHERLFIVEVMGRSSGFIAAQVGIAGGAESIIVPEQHQNLSKIQSKIMQGIRRGKKSSIIVVAEGKSNPTKKIADYLSKKGHAPRVCILGHTQRGGAPTAMDRLLAAHMGAMAVDALLRGKHSEMVAIQDNHIELVSFKKVFLQKKKPFPAETLELSQILSI